MSTRIEWSRLGRMWASAQTSYGRATVYCDLAHGIVRSDLPRWWWRVVVKRTDGRRHEARGECHTAREACRAVSCLLRGGWHESTRVPMMKPAFALADDFS